MTETKLVTRSLSRTTEDVAVLARCFAANDMPRPAAAFDWLYLRSPAGRTRVDVAEDVGGPEPITAAVYATLAVDMRVRGEVRPALQSLDTLTDARYRGKGLFVSLARGLFARAKAEGAALVYGFPNGSSAPGFFQKLEWQSLDPVPFLIRPLRVGYPLARLTKRAVPQVVADVPIPILGIPAPRGAELIEATRFDHEHTALWHDMAQDVGFAVERDAPYLNWRFGEKPGFRYRILELRAHRELRGFVVTSVQEKHGGRVAYVMELVAPRSERRIAAALLAEALRRDAADGAEVALAWSLRRSPTRLAHHAVGFLPLPERMRPIELHVGARAFDARLSGDIASRDAWYLSYADSDTV